MELVTVRAVACVRVQWSHGFDTRAVNMESVVGKVALCDRVLACLKRRAKRLISFVMCFRPYGRTNVTSWLTLDGCS